MLGHRSIFFLNSSSVKTSLIYPGHGWPQILTCFNATYNLLSIHRPTGRGSLKFISTCTKYILIKYSYVRIYCSINICYLNNISVRVNNSTFIKAIIILFFIFLEWNVLLNKIICQFINFIFASNFY